MTAEIVIMNKTAVALAADSKVTISGSIGKTFDTVNKVFTLSKLHPVGLMIYGNAEFMRCPWETIVKIYRSKKKAASFPTIADWGRDFIDFACSFDSISPEELTENLRSIVVAVFSDLYDEIRTYAREEKVKIGSKQHIDIAKLCIEKASKRLDSENIFTSRHMASVKRIYLNDIEELANVMFSNLGDADIITKAVSYAIRHIQSKSFSPNLSGIVVTGFGEQEIFPSVVHYQTDGFIYNKPKVLEEGIVNITRFATACIVPFAQKDMVERFMEGIDPAYRRLLHASFGKVLEENCLEVLNKYGSSKFKTKQIRDKILDALKLSWLENLKNTKEFQEQHYTDPITEMVSFLPKDELPNLAESLVALTSLKRHVSHDDETVGGPIDVALISKSDGFVWIKRKHYFSSELNPHFVNNYRRDIDGVEEHGKSASRTSAAHKASASHSAPPRSARSRK